MRSARKRTPIAVRTYGFYLIANCAAKLDDDGGCPVSRATRCAQRVDWRLTCLGEIWRFARNRAPTKPFLSFTFSGLTIRFLLFSRQSVLLNILGCLYLFLVESRHGVKLALHAYKFNLFSIWKGAPSAEEFRNRLRCRRGIGSRSTVRYRRFQST